MHTSQFLKSLDFLFNSQEQSRACYYAGCMVCVGWICYCKNMLFSGLPYKEKNVCLSVGFAFTHLG